MTQRVVYIYSSGPDPKSLPADTGDEVIFKILDWPVAATVDFGASSPFTDTKFQLDGRNEQLAFQSQTVLTKTIGYFHYDVIPDGSTREQPGTVSGDIEVSSTGTPPW